MDILYLYEFINIELLEIEKEKQIKAVIGQDVLKKEELQFEKPLKFNLTITRKGSKFLFNGEIEASIVLPCDRCLEEFSFSVVTDFNFLYILNEDILEYVNNNFLSLKDLVFGEIYLNIPFKKLCSENCKGLCPQCGTNLNVATCECEEIIDDNPFAKLKKILN